MKLDMAVYCKGSKEILVYLFVLYSLLLEHMPRMGLLKLTHSFHIYTNKDV